MERDFPPDSHAAEVARSGKSILKRSLPEWEEDRRSTTSVSGAPDEGAEVISAIFAPVKFGREVIGVLSVQSSRTNAYNAADVALLETCALYLAVRIHDAGEANAKREFRDLAAVDGLCGIANRRAFDEALRRCWDACALERRALSVLLIDVDFFKPFNDRYGHVAGDACLQQVARALDACIDGSGSLLARYGGEEFGAVLPGIGGPAAVAVAEQMQEAIGAGYSAPRFVPRGRVDQRRLRHDDPRRYVSPRCWCKMPTARSTVQKALGEIALPQQSISQPHRRPSGARRPAKIFRSGTRSFSAGNASCTTLRRR